MLSPTPQQVNIKLLGFLSIASMTLLLVTATAVSKGKFSFILLQQIHYFLRVCSVCACVTGHVKLELKALMGQCRQIFASFQAIWLIQCSWQWESIETFFEKKHVPLVVFSQLLTVSLPLTKCTLYCFFILPLPLLLCFFVFSRFFQHLSAVKTQAPSLAS